MDPPEKIQSSQHNTTQQYTEAVYNQEPQYPPQVAPPHQPGVVYAGQPVQPGAPQVAVMTLSQNQLTKFPQPATCPNCHCQITTTVTKRMGIGPWVLSGGLIIVGCWLGCCLIPFCIDDFKEFEHRCPNCSFVIGVKKLI